MSCSVAEKLRVNKSAVLAPPTHTHLHSPRPTCVSTQTTSETEPLYTLVYHLPLSSRSTGERPHAHKNRESSCQIIFR